MHGSEDPPDMAAVYSAGSESIGGMSNNKRCFVIDLEEVR